MLKLTCCVLLFASAFAADYSPYSVPQHARAVAQPPMDYNDDFRVKPGQNLFFNYEYHRRDQPPQVEMRDEDIGRYMYRPRPKTTTPTNLPALVKYNDYAVQVPASDRIEARARYPEVNVDGTSTPMPPPPPPPQPKWLDLNQDFFKSQKEYPPHSYYPVEPYKSQSVVPTTTTMPAPIKWSDPAQLYHIHTNMPSQYIPYQQVVASSTVRPHWTEIEAASNAAPVAQYPSSTHRPQRGRGQYKFNRNEEVATEAEYQAPSTHAPPRAAPPSSIPTLSPWSGDSFGK